MYEHFQSYVPKVHNRLARSPSSALQHLNTASYVCRNLGVFGVFGFSGDKTNSVFASELVLYCAAQGPGCHASVPVIQAYP